MRVRAKVPGLFRVTSPGAVMLAAVALLLGALSGRVWATEVDCFIAGTQILLADTTSVPIEDIVAGQRVLTLNLDSMELEPQVVLRVLGQYHTGVGEDFTIRISFSDGTVNQNTNSEPYYLPGKGWASYLPDLTRRRYGLEVRLLQVGDSVYRHTNNGFQAVAVAGIEEVRQGVQTYNLAGISGNSNFFANGILVHNKSAPPPGPPPTEPPDGGDQQQLAEAQQAVAAAEAALEGALHDLQEAVETGASGQEIARAQEAAADAAHELEAAQEARNQAVARAQEAAESQTQAQGTEADIALADGTPTAGDPVRLATGNFFLAVEDLSYRFARMTIQVSRSYQSNRQGSRSFGPGWSFNYDTRIVRGVKPDAAAQAAALWSDAAQAEQSYQRLHAEYLRSMQVFSTAIPQTAEAVRAVSAAVGAAQTALQKAQGVNNSSLISRANAALAGAQAAYAQAQALLASLWAAKDQLQASGFQIDGIRVAGLELRALAEQADREAALASANAGLNRCVVNEADRASLQRTGNGALSLIDENGVALLFLLDEQPDYESGQRLPDGTLNYYPSGSSLTPALPTEDTLRLLQEGGFLRTRKDGTAYRYDYLGRLTAIMDTNSNTISLAYSDAGHLERVSDGFGRSMSLQREGGRIVGIIDPLGRNFRYGYDAAGRLAEVTDGEGHTVRYRYSGPLLTTVIKPDDSFQEYA